MFFLTGPQRRCELLLKLSCDLAPGLVPTATAPRAAAAGAGPSRI